MVEPATMAIQEEEFVGQALLDVLEEASSPQPRVSNNLPTESGPPLSKNQRKKENKRRRELLEQNENSGAASGTAPIQAIVTVTQHPQPKKLTRGERKRQRAAMLAAQSGTGSSETTGGQPSIPTALAGAQAQKSSTRKPRLRNVMAAQAAQKQSGIPQGPKNGQPYQKNPSINGVAGAQNNGSLAVSTGSNGTGQGTQEHGVQHIQPAQQVAFNGNTSYAYLPPNKRLSHSEVMQINHYHNNQHTLNDQAMLGQGDGNMDWHDELQNLDSMIWPLSLSQHNNQMFGVLDQSHMFSQATFPMSHMPTFPSMQWPNQVQDFHTFALYQGQTYPSFPHHLHQRQLQRQHPVHASFPQENGPRRSSHLAENEATTQRYPFGNNASIQKAPKPKSPRIKSPRAPQPTTEYINQAHAAPQRLTTPQPLLIISDLNGTLIYRKVSSKTYLPRPELKSFLAHAFATHTMMIWTSARPHNATAILQDALTEAQRGQLIASWARDTLDLSPAQYDAKVQVYKRLERVWDALDLKKTHPNSPNERWSQANTLLMDDSLEKACAQLYNLVHVPELLLEGVKAEKAKEFPVLVQVQGYLDEARWWSDVSVFVRARPFKVGQGWERGGTEMSPAVMGELRLESGKFVASAELQDSGNLDEIVKKKHNKLRAEFVAEEAPMTVKTSKKPSPVPTATNGKVGSAPWWTNGGLNSWREKAVKEKEVASQQADPVGTQAATTTSSVQRAIDLQKILREKKELRLKNAASQPGPTEALTENQQAANEDASGEAKGGFQVRRIWTRDCQEAPGSGR